MKEGAALFEGIGLALTTDGGATFRVVADGGRGDALRVSGLVQRAGSLRAFVYRDGPDAAIDVAGAKLGAFEAQQVEAGEAKLLRWIRITGRDPLEAAASGGIDAPAGGALVASHGLLARVDTSSGAIVEMSEFASGKLLGPCGAGRAGQTAWLACSLSEDQVDTSLFDPFGVLRVSLDAPKLTAERTALVRNGEAELRVAPSGGAMLTSPCSAEDEGGACVRQPDGRWITIPIDAELGARGAGPLDSGGVAWLRGISDEDAAAALEEQDEASGDDARAARLHVAVIDASGKERALPALDIERKRDAIVVHSPIEEGADHMLRFVIDAGSGPLAVIQPLGHGSATVHRVPGAEVARTFAGRGLAVGKGRVLGSLDGGATWNEVPAPARVLEAVHSIDDPDGGSIPLQVSEIGGAVGSFLRIGWGPSDPESAEAPRAHAAGALSTLPAPRPAPASAEGVLTCTAQGASQSTPPLLGTAQLKDLLASKPPAEGTRRETSSWASGRRSMLGTIALFEEQGPRKADALPAKWTIRWHDPSEVGGKVYTWTSAPPKGALWGASLRLAAASGQRAFFALRAGPKYLLVRARHGGKSEVIETSSERLPTSDVVFGADKGEPIAWMHDTTLYVWKTGEPPRAIAQIARRSLHALGEPNKDGVPVFLSGADWAMTRTVPIPAWDPKAEARAPAAPSFDGWTRVPPVHLSLGALAPCGPKPKGESFMLQTSALEAQVDGIEEAASIALYDVRVRGEDACVAGVSALVTPKRHAAPRGGEAHEPAKGDKVKAPVGFLRADLVGQRAEGGDRGVLPASVSRMKCSLAPKP